MILEDIKTKLEEIDENVFYGMVDDSMKDTVWNYIVFNRAKISRSANKTSATDYFDVHVIRENFIPDGVDNEIIKRLCSLAGVKLSDEDASFNYVFKPNTNIVVEMLSLHFARARK